jgi:hypothetical protein
LQRVNEKGRSADNPRPRKTETNGLWLEIALVRWGIRCGAFFTALTRSLCPARLRVTCQGVELVFFSVLPYAHSINQGQIISLSHITMEFAKGCDKPHSLVVRVPMFSAADNSQTGTDDFFISFLSDVREVFGAAAVYILHSLTSCHVTGRA